jgi:hypothetical protein
MLLSTGLCRVSMAWSTRVFDLAKTTTWLEYMIYVTVIAIYFRVVQSFPASFAARGFLGTLEFLGPQPRLVIAMLATHSSVKAHSSSSK